MRECTKRAIEAYHERTYKNYNIRLRLDSDGDIIDMMEEYKSNAVPYREWLRDLMDGMTGQRVNELLQHFPKNQRIEITKNGDMLISGSDPGKHSGAMAKNWILKPNGTLSIEV